MSAAAAVIRLGRISYVNMAPVFHRLDAEVEQVLGVPTDLNRRLVAGELDAAPISSIEYARHAGELLLLPKLCVSSEGAVDSIQLVSKTPLERIRTVAVTAESATTVTLLKVLFPDVERVPADAPAEARLLIGDAALRSAFEDPTPHHDLGRLDHDARLVAPPDAGERGRRVLVQQVVQVCDRVGDDGAGAEVVEQARPKARAQHFFCFFLEGERSWGGL